jgi:uncharacterized protein (TIGR03437 family)
MATLRPNRIPVAVVAGLLLAVPVFAQGLLLNDPRAASGYRLIAPLGETTASLVDSSGQVVHQWTSSFPQVTVAYLLPNGNLLRTALIGNRQILAGGGSGRLEELAWDSTVVWAYEYSDARHILHHDVRRLPSGNYLMLAWELKSRQEALAAGVDPERVAPRGVLAEKIIEVRPSSDSGGEVVWEWNLWDHLIQGLYPSQANYGDVGSHPERIDLNFTADRSGPDVFHINGVDYNPELDQIVLSVRNFSEIWMLDHSTTTQEAAGHTGGRSGKGGGLLYRWGNPQAWAAGTEAQQQLFVQHNAHWIEPGLLGEGHLLIFNNANPGEPPYSSVVELELPLNQDGSYARAPGGDFGPQQPYWIYTAPNPGDFFSSFISGAQRLPNGNTLICSGGQGMIFEVSPEQESFWEYVVEALPNGQNQNVFRAYWYPVDFPGFVGTPLYAPAPVIRHHATARPGSQAPEALALALGEALAEGTEAAESQPLPTTLAGVTVEVMDGAGITRLAPLLLVSPTVIQFQMPAASAPGPGRVTIRPASGPASFADIRVDEVAPGLFAANGNGRGAGLIYTYREDIQATTPAFVYDEVAGQYLPAPIPAEALPGELYLLLTGVRKALAPGALEVTLGGIPLPVAEAMAHPQAPGVDQIKVGPIPAMFAGSGEQPVILHAGGKRSNTVTVVFGY